MHERRIPEWLRHAPTPSVRGFAALAGAEAIARGMLVSVFPIEVYNALRDTILVSQTYFLIGILSLATGLLVPFIGRYVPRRYIYVAGTLMFMAGTIAGSLGGPTQIVIALALITCATVTTFVCLNAYVLDYIARTELGRCETSRMFYSALGWTVGPVLGVMLLNVSRALPFVISGVAVALMLSIFLWMRLGNGRLINKSRHPPANPLAFLHRFFQQPRLVAGWLFAVIRSCGWWVYVVYMPIFAIKNGLGEELGGITLSLSNALLLIAPLMLRWMQRRSIRHAVRVGFLMSGLLFALAGFVSDFAWLSVICLLAGSFFLILLDVSAGLPFLLAVKPSERTEMSAIYASFRDVSGILTPGAAWLVLLFAPLAGVFVAGGVSLLGAWALSRRLHPRLGCPRASVAQAPPAYPAVAE